jgi:cell division protein ZapA
MAEVNVTLNGRVYGIACDDGQERRVKDLAAYVDQKLKEISRAGAASNEAHLLVLASIMLADEVFDMKDGRVAPLSNAAAKTPMAIQMTPEDEANIISAIDHLAARIDTIAGSLSKL